MRGALRYIIPAVAFIALYYALIFGYAASANRELHNHLAYAFPIPPEVGIYGNLQGGDLCADALDNGVTVCSRQGTVYFVDAHGKQAGKYVSYTAQVPTSYYAWAGGTRANLLFITVMDRSPSYPYNNRNETAAVNAVDSSGRVVWTVKLPPGVPVSWIAHTEDALYLLGNNYSVYKYDLAGKLLWEKQVPGMQSMQVGPTGRVYASVNANASYQWSYKQINGKKRAVAQPKPGQPRTGIVCLDASGNQLWRYNLQTYNSLPQYPQADAEGGLYFLDPSQGLIAVGANGVRRWQVHAPAAYSGGSPPWSLFDMFSGSNYGNPNSFGFALLAVGPKLVHFLSGDMLVCLDKSGAQLWDKELPGDPSSVVSAPDGTAYVALRRGGVVAFDPSGREKWHNHSIREISSDLSIGPDGRVYIEASDHLYCLKP